MRVRLADCDKATVAYCDGGSLPPKQLFHICYVKIAVFLLFFADSLREILFRNITPFCFRKANAKEVPILGQ